MKNTNKTLILAIVFTGFLSYVTPIYAVTSTQLNVRPVDEKIVPKVTVDITVTPKPTVNLKIAPAKNLEIKLPLRKTNALKEIDRRVAKLDLLESKIIAVKRLTNAQITALTAAINAEIKSLTTIRAKIEAETDSDFLKQEKQAITDSYKIFALYVPEIEIISHADRLIDVADALVGKTTDPDLKQAITEAKTAAEKAISLVIVLTPEGADNKNVLKQARDLLRQSRTGLNTVYSGIKGK